MKVGGRKGGRKGGREIQGPRCMGYFKTLAESKKNARKSEIVFFFLPEYTTITLVLVLVKMWERKVFNCNFGRHSHKEFLGS